MQAKESSIYNLGNGQGYTVREVIETVRKVTNSNIIAEEAKRRPGDPARLIASAQKIKEELNWSANFPDLDTIIETAWQWHKMGGFEKE